MEMTIYKTRPGEFKVWYLHPTHTNWDQVIKETNHLVRRFGSLDKPHYRYYDGVAMEWFEAKVGYWLIDIKTNLTLFTTQQFHELFIKKYEKD